jgi:5-methyltetrahydropteroyltriglutamate--homocysteine methyltransferase
MSLTTTCIGAFGKPDYLKADPRDYLRLADLIDRSCVDEVSIEDAHCGNDLSLLERFQNSRVILGAVTIVSSEVESLEYISTRITQALRHIDRSRLVIAPDCGLTMLSRELAIAKLTNMCAAARAV